MTFLFALILAPLLVHLRGWKPAALFFAVATVYAVFGAVGFAQVQIVLSQVRDTESAYRDTYYVVYHRQFLINLGAVMAILGAITWVQTRFDAMRYPALTKLLFWILHIAFIGSTSFQGALAFALPTPRRYIDYPDFMDSYVLISSWSGFLSQAALLGLACLLLESIIVKFRAK